MRPSSHEMYTQHEAHILLLLPHKTQSHPSSKPCNSPSTCCSCVPPLTQDFCTLSQKPVLKPVLSPIPYCPFFRTLCDVSHDVGVVPEFRDKTGLTTFENRFDDFCPRLTSFSTGLQMQSIFLFESSHS